MSRSYKKHPVLKEHRSGRFGKTMANRKVRRFRLETTGKSMLYKKCFESWDIQDYALRFPLEDMLLEWEDETSWLRQTFPQRKDLIGYWRKTTLGK